MEELTLPNQVLAFYTNRGITPNIIIQGIWLREYGFEIDSKLQMEIEQDKITITPQSKNQQSNKT